MVVKGEKLEAIVETLDDKKSTTYEGVLDYDSERGWVDVDRVVTRLSDVLEGHGCYVSKVKEDANSNDGVVRVWFRETELS
jgi:hypothetical protein